MQLSNDMPNINFDEFKPYMIECAYDYYTICVSSPHQRMGVQTVMCTLAIEILLKSFNAKVDSNHGRIDETYEFSKKEALPKKANAHDLKVLYKSLPKLIQSYLFDSLDLDILEVNKDLFTTNRYMYEINANTIHNDDIIKLTARLICKIVNLYRYQGCKDLFIKELNVEKLYYSHIQLEPLVTVL
jgi:hypothetical protein